MRPSVLLSAMILAVVGVQASAEDTVLDSSIAKIRNVLNQEKVQMANGASGLFVPGDYGVFSSARSSLKESLSLIEKLQNVPDGKVEGEKIARIAGFAERLGSLAEQRAQFNVWGSSNALRTELDQVDRELKGYNVGLRSAIQRYEMNKKLADAKKENDDKKNDRNAVTELEGAKRSVRNMAASCSETAKTDRVNTDSRMADLRREGAESRRLMTITLNNIAKSKNDVKKGEREKAQAESDVEKLNSQVAEAEAQIAVIEKSYKETTCDPKDTKGGAGFQTCAQGIENAKRFAQSLSGQVEKMNAEITKLQSPSIEMILEHLGDPNLKAEDVRANLAIQEGVKAEFKERIGDLKKRIDSRGRLISAQAELGKALGDLDKAAKEKSGNDKAQTESEKQAQVAYQARIREAIESVRGRLEFLKQERAQALAHADKMAEAKSELEKARKSTDDALANLEQISQAHGARAHDCNAIFREAFDAKDKNQLDNLIAKLNSLTNKDQLVAGKSEGGQAQR